MSTLPEHQSHGSRLPDRPRHRAGRRRIGWLCFQGNIVRLGRLSWPCAAKHRRDALCRVGLCCGL